MADEKPQLQPQNASTAPASANAAAVTPPEDPGGSAVAVFSPLAR